MSDDENLEILKKGLEKGISKPKDLAKSSLEKSNMDKCMIFEKLLGKLNEPSTVEVGFKEIQNFIKENLNKKSLTMYISSLSKLHSNCTNQSKERQALLIGFISTQYKENLIYSLDKHVNQTIKRLIDLLSSLCQDSNEGVYLASSNSLIEMYNSSFEDKNNLQSIIQYFFEPFLESLNSGKMKGNQIYSSFCLNELIKSFSGNIDLLRIVYPKILSILFKSNIKTELPLLLSSLSNLIEKLEFAEIKNEMKEILIRILNKFQNNLNAQVKFESITIFKFIGEKIRDNSSSVDLSEEIVLVNQIIFELQRQMKEKNYKIQIAANETLKIWLDILRNIEQNNINSNEIQSPKGISSLHFIKNLAQSSKRINNDEILKKEIYSRGITNILRTSDFLKRGKIKEMYNEKVISSSRNVKSSTKHHINHRFREKNFEENIEKGEIQFHDNQPNLVSNNQIGQNMKETLKLANSDGFKNNFIFSSISNSFPFEFIKNKLLGSFDTMCQNFVEKMNDKFDILENKSKLLKKKIHELKANKKLKIKEKTNKIKEQNAIYLEIKHEITPNINPKNYKSKTELEREINKNDPTTIKIWRSALNDLSEKKYNSSYSKIIDSQDDILLLRLLYITGPLLDKLSFNISKKLIVKLNLIVRSNQIEDIIYKILYQAFEINLYQNLDPEFQNEVLETLYQYKNIEGEIGKRSELLYNHLVNSQ